LCGRAGGDCRALLILDYQGPEDWNAKFRVDEPNLDLSKDTALHDST